MGNSIKCQDTNNKQQLQNTVQQYVCSTWKMSTFPIELREKKETRNHRVDKERFCFDLYVCSLFRCSELRTRALFSLTTCPIPSRCARIYSKPSKYNVYNSKRGVGFNSSEFVNYEAEIHLRCCCCL